MTPAETLAAAAALIREQHGAGCPDHQFWAATAEMLEDTWSQASAAEELYGPHIRFGAWVERPLRLARAYLASQGVAACASS
jgi:hypothetical protein